MEESLLLFTEKLQKTLWPKSKDSLSGILCLKMNTGEIKIQLVFI